MGANEPTLRIELEEIGARSWWRGLLAIFATQSSAAYLRFVGRVGDEVRFHSATFSAPRTLGVLPPREEWAPGMNAALTSLVEEIESAGWVQVGQDEDPWRPRFEHPDPAAGSGPRRSV